MWSLLELGVATPLALLVFAPGLCAAQESPEDESPHPASSESDGPDPHTADEPEATGSGAVGYAPGEGFRLKSNDGDYMLRISVQLGLRVEPSWADNELRYNGAFALLRPIIRGNVYRPWLAFRLSMDLAGDTPSVLDAYIDVEPWKEFGFRFGQQGTPLSRHNAFGPQQLFFPEYSGVAGYFWSGRERGVTFYGTLFSERLDYFAGAYSGAPEEESVDLSSDYVVEGRLTFSPAGPVNANELPFTPEGGLLPFGVSITAQGYFGKLRPLPEGYNSSYSVLTPARSPPGTETGVAGADLWFQYGRVIAFGELYWRTQNPTGTSGAIHAYGAWSQVVVNAYANIVGVGARVSWIDPDVDLANDQALEAEAQLAWFIHAPELVLKLRYAWLDQRSPDVAEAADVVLPFAEGRTNLVTLQLTAAF
jgi:hypothetical protein